MAFMTLENKLKEAIDGGFDYFGIADLGPARHDVTGRA
jgi:hypothetical protein